MGNGPLRPVGVGPRVIARLINAAIGSAAYAVFFFAQFTAFMSSSGSSGFGWLLIGMVPALGFIVWQIMTIVKHSTTVGGKFQNITYIDTRTRQPIGAKLILKLLLQSLMEGLVFGLGAITYFFGYKDGQHWIDRALSVAAVETSSLGNAAAPPVAPPPPMSTGAVTPVMLPSRSKQEPETPFRAQSKESSPQFDNPVPGFGQVPSPQQELSQPQPSQQSPFARPNAPATSPASATQQAALVPPSAPEPSPSTNPWAFPPQSAASVPPPSAPVPLAEPKENEIPPPPQGFTPPGQAPLAAAPLMPPQPRAKLDDETVLDPNVLPQVSTVVLDDDEKLVVDGPLVLGRNPQAPERYSQARLKALDDPSLRMSKTHLVLLPDGRGVAVVDLGARNGVVFESSSGKGRIPTDQVTPIPDGVTVHFGGRSLQVNR